MCICKRHPWLEASHVGGQKTNMGVDSSNSEDWNGEDRGNVRASSGTTMFHNRLYFFAVIIENFEVLSSCVAIRNSLQAL